MQDRGEAVQLGCLLLRTKEKQYSRAARLRRAEERHYSKSARCSGEREGGTTGLLALLRTAKKQYSPGSPNQGREQAVQQGCPLLRTEERQYSRHSTARVLATQDRNKAVQLECSLLRSEERQQSKDARYSG